MANRKLIYGQSGSVTFADGALATGWYPSPYDILPIRAALLSQAYVTDDPIHDLEIVNKKYADALALGSLGIKAANLICAGPISGSPAFATFRSLVGADFPVTLSISVLSVTALAVTTLLATTLSVDSLSISTLTASRYIRTDINKFLVTDIPDEWMSSSSYDTLELANTAAYAAGKLLKISKNHTLTANTILTASVMVIPGGSFTKASTYTLTINGPFEAGLYQVFSGFSGDDITFAAGTIQGVRGEWLGAKADNLDASAIANTTALNAAALCSSTGVVYYGKKQNLLLSAGVYKVTTTSGNYALTVKCPIKGEGPYVSIIHNIGTGSALAIEGIDGEIYFSRFSGFTVKGNASSEDGICLNITGNINKALGYSKFDNVDSCYHGRHGLVHRKSWATRYDTCRFSYNGGLGVNLYAGEGTHNNIIFTNCDSNGNGGTGNASADFTKGGVRIPASDSVSWNGGAVESNNAWNFIIGGDSAGPANIIAIRDVYSEGSPPSTATSATGGFLYLSSRYQLVSVNKCRISNDAAAGKTTYAFYVASASTDHSSAFKEWDNEVIPSGAGTPIRDYGINYVDKWGSNTELITAQVDRDFSGANHWVNGDFDTFDASGDLSLVASATSTCYLPQANINNGAGFVYGKRYGIKYDASGVTGTIFISSAGQLVRLPNFTNGTGQSQEFTWLETNANQKLYIRTTDAGAGNFDNFSIVELESGISPQSFLNGLLSVTTVPLTANGDTTLYTVPTGKRCVLTYAVLVADADAGTTTISIGADGAETNFIPANTLSNLDAQYDVAILRPIPNTTPLLGKSYAAGTVIQAQIANQAGAGSSTLYLYGLVY